MLCFSPGLFDVPDSIARRDATRKHFEEKRTAARGDKMVTSRECDVAVRKKGKETMDMFQTLAKQRFGYFHTQFTYYRECPPCHHHIQATMVSSCPANPSWGSETAHPLSPL